MCSRAQKALVQHCNKWMVAQMGEGRRVNVADAQPAMQGSPVFLIDQVCKVLLDALDGGNEHSLEPDSTTQGCHDI
jgi:hypothetical protein